MRPALRVTPAQLLKEMPVAATFLPLPAAAMQVPSSADGQEF
jgi:hypothetical protein